MGPPQSASGTPMSGTPLPSPASVMRRIQGGPPQGPDPWGMSDEQRNKYQGFFSKVAEPDGFARGIKVAQLLSLSGLSNQVLAKVWTLSDADKDNKLSVMEFAVAMHLTHCMKNLNLSLPDVLPPALGGGSQPMAQGSMPGMGANKRDPFVGIPGLDGGVPSVQSSPMGMGMQDSMAGMPALGMQGSMGMQGGMGMVGMPMPGMLGGGLNPMQMQQIQMKEQMEEHNRRLREQQEEMAMVAHEQAMEQQRLQKEMLEEKARREKEEMETFRRQREQENELRKDIFELVQRQQSLQKHSRQSEVKTKQCMLKVQSLTAREQRMAQELLKWNQEADGRMIELQKSEAMVTSNREALRVNEERKRLNQVRKVEIEAELDKSKQYVEDHQKLLKEQTAELEKASVEEEHLIAEIRGKKRELSTLDHKIHSSEAQVETVKDNLKRVNDLKAAAAVVLSMRQESVMRLAETKESLNVMHQTAQRDINALMEEEKEILKVIEVVRGELKAVVVMSHRGKRKTKRKSKKKNTPQKA